MTDPELASHLVTQAARLVRLMRQLHDIPASHRILSMLDESGPLGVSALAQLDRCSQPTMSAAVAALVEAGYVDKQPHPSDARSSVVTITTDGRAELGRSRRSYGATIAARLEGSGLADDDVAAAVAVLRAVMDPQQQTPTTPLPEGALA
jgi:DNA-binding MarR family transcriptional regulator